MTCQNCAKQVENALNAIDGVWVEVDLKQNRAMVRQKEQISVEKLVPLWKKSVITHIFEQKPFFFFGRKAAFAFCWQAVVS